MPSLRPLQSLWSPSGLLWIVFGGEALALVLALAPGITGDRLVWFGINSVVVQWISLTTLGLLYLGRHRLGRLSTAGMGCAGLCLLLVCSSGSVGLLWLGFSAPLHLTDDSWRPLLGLTTSLTFLIGLLAIVAAQNHLRLQRLAVQASRAELQALQARIRPHFLFNTLNAAVSLVRSEPGKAEDLLMDMADLFRAALGSSELIPLQQELQLCQRYLAIEQARFGSRLETAWQLPTQLPELNVPPLCLQPLLENAVHHGVERSHQASRLIICATLNGNQLLVTVSNPLHSSPGTPHRGHGVGLQAVRARLAQMPTPADLQTWQAEGHFHARLHFTLPDQVTTR